MTGRVLEMVTLFLRKSLEGDWESGDRDDLVETLVAQGHNFDEISAALTIVDKIEERLDAPQTLPGAPVTERFFQMLEEFHLPTEVRGYLHQLVTMDVLDPVQREEVVERCLLIEPDEITLEDAEVVVEDLLSETPKIIGGFDETISDYYH